MKYFFIVVLSIIWPGVGHFFIKKYKLGLILLIISILLSIIFFQFLLIKYYLYVIYYIISIIIIIFSIINAILIYKNNKFSLRYLSGIILVFIIIALKILFINTVMNSLRFRTSIMRSSVMANTLMMGEKVIVDYSKNYKYSIQTGDIIVYKYRDENSASHCIALENDKIKIIDNNVFINDIMINEPYKNLDQEQFERVKYQNRFDEINYDLSETIIDKNHVFILADNRYNGRDSRFIGQLSRDAIIGKVLYIYSSKNRERIGKKIE